MKTLFLNIAILGCFTPFLIACEQSPKTVQNEQKVESKSVDAEPTAAPSMSYEALYVSEEGVGHDNVFKISGGNLFYSGRMGTSNVLEQVMEDAEYIEYLELKYAYKFGDKYVVIVSTNPYGRSCPATTHVFSFDTQSESVIGAKEIDGCSQVVQAFAEGNKLIVKKEGEQTTIYNADINTSQL